MSLKMRRSRTNYQCHHGRAECLSVERLDKIRAVDRESLDLPKFERESLDIGCESLDGPKFDCATGVQIFATNFWHVQILVTHAQTFATHFWYIQAIANHGATNF